MEEHRIRSMYAARDERRDEDSMFNTGQLFLLQQRERQALRLLRRSGFTPLWDRRIIDVGCGNGTWIRQLVLWGADPEKIVGVDLLPQRIEQAKRTCPSSVRLLVGSATELQAESHAFDLAVASTLFTSILDAGTRSAIANEILRVLADNGAVLWYDFFVNNPKNPAVSGVRKKEIRRLFPSCTPALERLTLAPPLARRVAPRSWILCELLSRVPLLRTHYLGLIPKGPTGK
jgi:ubiquinone/menaquinone biosynthesis C-methylase UbiE